VIDQTVELTQVQRIADRLRSGEAVGKIVLTLASA